MSDIRFWENTAAGNNKGAPPDYAPEGATAMDQVTDIVREVQGSLRRWHEDAEWVWGYPTDTVTVTYLAANQFRINGVDVTGTYSVGRRVRAVGTLTGTITGTISVSTFTGGNTEITANYDSGSLQNEALVVSAGILSQGAAKFVEQTGAPTQDDDTTKGYVIGDAIYSSTETKAIHDCVKATAGAAEWIQRGVIAGEENWPAGYITRTQKLLITGGGITGGADATTIRVDADSVLLRRRLSDFRGGPAEKSATLAGPTILLAAANGPGGLDIGAYAPNTWYRIFVVSGGAGTALVGTAESNLEPDWTNLAGYDIWRAPIGYYRLSGTAGSFIAFAQHGDHRVSPWVPYTSLSAVRSTQDFSDSLPYCVEGHFAIRGDVMSGNVGTVLINPNPVETGPAGSAGDAQQDLSQFSGNAMYRTDSDYRVQFRDPIVRQARISASASAANTSIYATGCRFAIG